MKLFDPNNPNEKKKVIAAGGLGLAAVAVLGYAFFGGSSKAPAKNTNGAAKPTPVTVAKTVRQIEETPADPSMFQPIEYGITAPGVPEANRNIFAYYEPPPLPVKMPTIVPPSPTPTPPMTATSLAPSNVYARTADFSLQVIGDKFTPAVRVVIDGRELPTRFINAQQLFTTVPAALITNPGGRQVVVRSSDGKLYADPITLTVTPPPLPNFDYVGILGKPRFNDSAVLRDKSSKELMTVQRGDLLSGRFRVSSISEKDVILIDANLKIRHQLPFTTDTSGNPSLRPPVRTSDDEPDL